MTGLTLPADYSIFKNSIPPFSSNLLFFLYFLCIQPCLITFSLLLSFTLSLSVCVSLSIYFSLSLSLSPSFPLSRSLFHSLYSIHISLFISHLFTLSFFLIFPFFSLALVWQVTKGDITSTLTSVCNKILHDHSASSVVLKDRREGKFLCFILNTSFFIIN